MAWRIHLVFPQHIPKGFVFFLSRWRSVASEIAGQPAPCMTILVRVPQKNVQRVSLSRRHLYFSAWRSKRTHDREGANLDHTDCVSAFHPDSGAPLHDERPSHTLEIPIDERR